MLIDYILPYRLIIKKINTEKIDKEADMLLPEPYNHGLMIASCRKEGFNLELNILEHGTVDVNSFNRKVTDFLEKHQIELAAAEAGALFGVDIFEKFSHIDHYVYEGMARLTNQQFDTLADLGKKISEYHHSFWNGLSDKAIDKVAGHVGEVYAADHLTQFGTQVIWPDVSNQPGWDLLINGHEVNVKLVSDFSSLSGHFQTYPDIPVIIPGDTSHIPSDAIHIHSMGGMDQVMEALTSSGKDRVVLVDDLLSHDHVVNQVSDATDTLLGGQTLADFHFPFATLLFSGWREAGLLMDGRTEVKNSLLNVGLDVAGGGIGAGLGAKGGALIGMVLGPIGAGVGAVLGGIAGAIGGRVVSNNIKKQPFERALKELKENEQVLKVHIQKEEGQFQLQYQSTKQKKQMQLLHFKNTEIKKLKTRIQQVQESRSNLEWLSREQVNGLLDHAIIQVEESLSFLQMEQKKTPFLRRIIYPSVNQFALEQAHRRLCKFRRELLLYKKQTKNIESMQRNEVFSFLAGRGLSANSVYRSILQSEDTRLRAELQLRNDITTSQQLLVDQRVHAVQSLVDLMNKLKEQSRNRLNPLIEKTTASQNQVLVMGNRLGIIK